MDLSGVITVLKLKINGELAQLLGSQWRESQASLPAGQLFFLAPEFVRAACRDLEFADEATRAALTAAEQVAAQSALMALAWHFHHCFAVCPAYKARAINRWPAPEEQGALPGMVYALVLMSALPRMRAPPLSIAVGA